MLKKIILLSTIMLFCAACEGGLFKDRNVDYKVSTNGGSVIIKYEDKDGETVIEQMNGINWRQNFEAKKDAFLYLKATGRDTAQIIKVSIENNGSVLKTNTADGDSVTVVVSTNID